MRPYGLSVLRLCVGAIFVAHGAQKLFGVWGGPGLSGTTSMMTGLGLPYPSVMAILLTLSEFCGGILLLLGWLTPWASVSLVIAMIVAIWKVHGPNGFFMNWANTPGQGHGIEYNLALAGALLCLLLAGPGALSIDDWRSRTHEARERGRARIRKV
jgi:putative oxidoreductase